MKYLVCMVLLLTGCATANMLKRPGNVNKYAPVDERPLPGSIEYLNQGSATEVRSRREDAFRQMHQTCNMKYKILTERLRDGETDVRLVDGSAVYTTEKFNVITFQCEG